MARGGRSVSGAVGIVSAFTTGYAANMPSGSGAGPREDHTPPGSPGGVILLVDDDRDFRGALVDALSAEVDHVIEAATGQAALQALEALRARGRPLPDLIIVDLMMPQMGGIELIQRLRRNPHWSRVRTLVMTGINDPMLRVRLDLPVAFKADLDATLAVVRHELARAGTFRRGQRSVMP